MRSSPEPLFTPGFFALVGVLGAVTLAAFHRLAAEAAQVPALACEIGRVFAPDLARLFGVVLFVGVFCAGSAVMS